MLKATLTNQEATLTQKSIQSCIGSILSTACKSYLVVGVDISGAVIVVNHRK